MQWISREFRKKSTVAVPGNNNDSPDISLYAAPGGFIMLCDLRIKQLGNKRQTFPLKYSQIHSVRRMKKSYVLLSNTKAIENVVYPVDIEFFRFHISPSFDQNVLFHPYEQHTDGALHPPDDSTLSAWQAASLRIA